MIKRPHVPVLLDFLTQHPGWLALLTSLVIVSALLESLTAAALFPFMTAVIGNENVSQGGPVLDALNQTVEMIPLEDKVLAATLILLGIVLFKGAAVLGRETLISHGACRIVHESKLSLLNHLVMAPYAFFLRSRDGDLMYRLSTAAQSLNTALLLLPAAAMQVCTIFAISLLLVTIDWMLTILIGIVGLFIYTGIRYASRRMSYAMGKGRAEAMANELVISGEFLRGIRDITVAGSASFWVKRFETESNRFRRIYAKDLVWQVTPGVFIEMSFFLCLTVLVIFYHVRGGSLSGQVLPIMAVYVYALYRMVGAVNALVRHKLRISSLLPDVDLLRDSFQIIPQQVPDLGRDGLTIRSDLVFNHVSFTYPEAQSLTLTDVSFEVRKGMVTAIIGPSGAGKSTMIHLLTRLFDPTSGQILIDGEDLARYRRDAWLRRVGYVGQEAFIFNGTIQENIRFGLKEVSEDKIERAAEVAQAHEFVTKLPQGYSTVIGERGMTLSGGQRQRLAIARAVLREPELFIFDEATSAVDPLSEALIQQAISSLSKDHIVILVAHRITTIKFADQIMVLDHGRVVEMGSHEDLLSRKGTYSLMMASSLES